MSVIVIQGSRHLGNPVLWLIGVDEDEGVVQTSQTDLASWLGQVASEFDGIAPAATDLLVPTESGNFTALLFDTSRLPFVVKNAAFGAPGAGAVSHEVPWRDGTSTRSARRDELIRILVPLETLPSVEILSANISLSEGAGLNPAYAPGLTEVRRSDHLIWTIILELYVTPRGVGHLVLPVHLVRIAVAGNEGSIVEPDNISFSLPSRAITLPDSSVWDSHTVQTTASEAIISGPGKVYLQAFQYEKPRDVPAVAFWRVDATIRPAGQERGVALNLVATRLPGAGPSNTIARWQFSPSD